MKKNKTPFLQRNFHLEEQEVLDKVAIDNLQAELGLAQVNKTSNKRLARYRKG